ncbi:MAG TPA: MSMEG_0565 family glycosyltransferase [Stellaceae bacterium]|nr:MSMEG_0565 family glycosyltransferase [Stellaceae bacterium]
MSAGRAAKPLRIAMLTHSTNPRGAVVHALELAEALTALGHEVAVHAPDPRGAGFFRATRCRTVPVAARPVSGGLAELVETRIADYLRHFSAPGAERFDLYHAQDGISGNALLRLRRRGAIDGFLRTVHHVDRFGDPRLDAWQKAAIVEADRVLCVSRLWQDVLARDYGIAATCVGNGVDTERYRPEAGPEDSVLCARLGLGRGPIYLSIGGIEARKNSERILRAFLAARRMRPMAQLVVAGGASLLDHSDAQASFDALLRESGLEAGPGAPVVSTGPVPDADMPALYRLADALVFPSLREGFGLVVLEAMASGTPVIVSRLPPFTEYLGEEDCLWVDPTLVEGIAAAMLDAAEAPTRRRLAAAGPPLCRRHGWRACAEAHLAAYAACRSSCPETAHA